MSTVNEAAAFLDRFRDAMARHGLTLWRRRKNEDFLLDTGFTREDAGWVIRKLEPSQYEWGPQEDDNDGRSIGEVWAFATEFEGFELFVKLKLGTSGSPSAECISFHEAERAARQPFRRQR